MNYIDRIKQNSINEFGSKVTQDRYVKIAEQGLWESEGILIKKYFLRGSKVLDVGCGTGRTTIPLYKIGYKIIGIDITPQMIDTARMIAQSKKLNIDYRVGDATDLKFDDNFFENIIFANNGWAQIPGKQNRQRALNEIYRVLKPGGYFIFTAHRRYYSLYYLLFWAKNWVKYYIFKPLGLKIKEIDFGDLFFDRSYKIKGLKQRQFIHITNSEEVEEQIKESGFKLEMKKNMGEISKSDAEAMRATLSNKDDAYKSPVFYVCQKEK